MTRVHKSPLPFVKLYFGRMSTSSLWEEPPETRLLFIWFVGVADIDGNVLPHTVTNLARLANLPLDKTKAALETLESPDPGSRTKSYDGRRLLKRDDGGWLVVNATAYREMQTPKQAADAARQAKHRAGKPRKSKHKPLTRSQREKKSFDEAAGNVAPDRDYTAE